MSLERLANLHKAKKELENLLDLTYDAISAMQRLQENEDEPQTKEIYRAKGGVYALMWQELTRIWIILKDC